MTQHPISEDDLHAYVDGALDSARRDDVEAYLAQHPDVADRIAGYRRQRSELRGALAPIAEEPVPFDLNLARLVEMRMNRPRRSWRDVAAALVLLMTGLAGGWIVHGQMRSSDEGIIALTDEAADNYTVYAPDEERPVEISGLDRPKLVAWASRRLKRDVTVPDLSASGYRFMGGRLVATAHGPAMMLMYDNSAGTRLVMFMRRMKIDRNTRMAEHSAGSLSGFSWASKGLGYSVVGPVAPDTLHPLADEIRRQVASTT